MVNQPSIFWSSALGLEAGAISEEPNTFPPGAERFLAEVFAKRDLGLALELRSALFKFEGEAFGIVLTFRLACCGMRRA